MILMLLRSLSSLCALWPVPALCRRPMGFGRFLRLPRAAFSESAALDEDVSCNSTLYRSGRVYCYRSEGLAWSARTMDPTATKVDCRTKG